MTWIDARTFKTKCCEFHFIGMNHSPEGPTGICRHCNQIYGGEVQLGWNPIKNEWVELTNVPKEGP